MVDHVTLENMERDVRSGDKNLMKAYQTELFALATKHGGSADLLRDIRDGEKNILANTSYQSEITNILAMERSGTPPAAPATPSAVPETDETTPEPAEPASAETEGSPAGEGDVDLDASSDSE